MRIGIIGHGAFGQLLATLVRKFRPEDTLKIYAPEATVDGTTLVSLAEACEADVVFLAVPIRVFETVLQEVLPCVPASGIIVDIATVKVYTANLLKKHAAGRKFVSAHPLFGPESYAKRGNDSSGFRVVLAEHTLAPEELQTLISFAKVTGFDLIQMSAEEHDRLLAETLFLTHFIGQMVERAGFTRTRIDTPSFGFLMDAVESVRNDSELFKDVFAFNPYCEEVLTRLKKAEAQTHDLIGKK